MLWSLKEACETDCEPYLRNGEVSGVLNVARLLVQLGEGGVHAFVLTAGLALLLWSWLLRGGAPLRLAVHRRREHLQRSKGDSTDSGKLHIVV